MLVSDGSWVSETCKAISTASVDQADLDRRLAIFTADKLLSYYKPLVRPIIPLSVVKYRNLTSEQKFKFNKDNPDWRSAPAIGKFLALESSVEVGNMSNVWWLQNCQKLVDDDDRKDKIQVILDLYEPDLRRHSTPRPHVDPEVESIRELFGGTVGRRNEE